MNCEHKFEEDERFKSGGVIMLSGPIGKVEQETRMVCKKCGRIDYVPKITVSTDKDGEGK